MPFETRLKDGRTLLVDHAVPADAAQIVAYVEQASGESDFLSFGAGEFGISVDDEVNFIASLGAGRSGFMLKGVLAGQVVSTCVVTRPARPRLRHIGEFGISVAKSHWGLGVGKAMCRAMLDVAREAGITKVNLEVREDNAGAIRVYESVGFQREGITPRGIKLGDKYFANIIMGICLD